MVEVVMELVLAVIVWVTGCRRANLDWQTDHHTHKSYPPQLT